MRCRWRHAVSDQLSQQRKKKKEMRSSQTKIEMRPSQASGMRGQMKIVLGGRTLAQLAFLTNALKLVSSAHSSFYPFVNWWAPSTLTPPPHTHIAEMSNKSVWLRGLFGFAEESWVEIAWWYMKTPKLCTAERLSLRDHDKSQMFVHSYTPKRRQSIDNPLLY